ncbi:MAG: porphobilinogen synthase [Syntrophomonadaceae bacterium]|nr:porphobilinogen synthase [Syntrophomonadaceae bacterium]
MDGFPLIRLRRLRENPALRQMIKETVLQVTDLIYPLFVIPGEGITKPISSMPGICQRSVDQMLCEVDEVYRSGIPAILLFGIPERKDDIGSGAYAASGIVQTAVKAIKKRYPSLVVITDVCLCEYTSHGHCGIVAEDRILNDPTLELLAKTALSHVEAGADIVAPSDMMDGRVKAIRQKLDAHGFIHAPIMSYSVKYASAFYGPFREAAESAPKFGDRRSHQMDPANKKEALREIEQDLHEGADMVMIKPALAYLDVINQVKKATHIPVVAYNVSGEYAMVKAAASSGWLDERPVVMEIMTGIKRAGADLIITYHAKDVARWLQEA